MTAGCKNSKLTLLILRREGSYKVCNSLNFREKMLRAWKCNDYASVSLGKT